MSLLVDWLLRTRFKFLGLGGITIYVFLCCINWPLTFNNELLTISTWELVWFTGSMSTLAPANIASVSSLLSKYVCLLWGVYQEWQCTTLYISVSCIKSNLRESRIQRTVKSRPWELSILNSKHFHSVLDEVNISRNMQYA